MTDTAVCFSLIRGRVMRVTRLDACGNRVLGPDSTVVSKGFISVALSAQTDTGSAISVQNANGDTCVEDTPPPKFKGYNVDVNFCGVNPDLVNLMTGQERVYNADATPLAVGFRMNTDVDLSGSGFALEVWSNVPSGTCDAAGNQQYGYFLVPFLQGGIIGDFTIQNDAVNFTMTGAASKDGNAWGVGPYDVVADGSSLPSPLLVALDAKDHLNLQLTTIAPPTEVCGAIPLGVPATGATAGTPGTYTPANSYGPGTFATIGALTASPGTAWTTGQRIVLRDGTTAYWNGTAWVAGIAP